MQSEKQLLNCKNKGWKINIFDWEIDHMLDAFNGKKMSIHLEWVEINEYLLLYLYQFALFIPVGKQFCFYILWKVVYFSVYTVLIHYGHLI